MGQTFSFATLGVESFPLDLPRARWRNLVRADYMLMVKPMVVGFCFIGFRCYSRWWVRHLRTLAQFQGNEMRYVGSVQDFIFWSCVWCESNKLRCRVSPRFPCVTPVEDSFSSDLLRAIISYWTESHLESCQTSTKIFISSVKIANGLKSSTISTKKLHRRVL